MEPPGSASIVIEPAFRNQSTHTRRDNVIEYLRRIEQERGVLPIRRKSLEREEVFALSVQLLRARQGMIEVI